MPKKNNNAMNRNQNHRLLERQLNKHLVDFDLKNEKLLAFLKAINNSYKHYESSRVLIERAMEISNLELEQANKKLLKESEIQNQLIERLKKSINAVSIDGKQVENNDLFQITEILNSEIVGRKRLESKLDESRIIAENALKSKERFLANMSHEIRTPLNAILGMSWLLANTKLNENQKEYQDVIKVSAQNLLIVINDILDLSKITSGKFELEYIDFNLFELVENLIKTVSYKASEKGIDLTFKKDDSIKSFVTGDPTRLNQVLLNLVSNAIKFTNKGSVELYLKQIESGKKFTTIKFIVTDTGIGISEPKIKEVFNSFSQEDSSISRKYGGTGLGLTISKELVESFSSKLEVKSTKGVGSEFSFQVKFQTAKTNDKDIKTIKEEKVDYNLDGYKILIVEDNEFNRLKY